MLRALHNNLEEMDKVLYYAELLTSRWPKKAYWTQLSGLYAQAASEDGLSEEEAMELEKKQLAAFEMAHRQGMLESGRELETMAQLYLQATAFINGKDMAEAVEPLMAAAEMADDGNLYMRLANVYLNLDKYDDAAQAIDKALDKGGLRRPDQSSLLQGQAYLALENFDEARKSFREAAKDERSEKMARNLLRYVDSEERRIKDIREYLS